MAMSDWDVKTPHRLLDKLRKDLKLPTDRALCKMLGCSVYLVSRIRSGHLRVSPAFVLKVHKLTGLPVSDIESMCK